MKDQYMPDVSELHAAGKRGVRAGNEWNAVISRIASQGLKSAAQLQKEGTQFFPSDDEFPRNYVCGISIFPLRPGIEKSNEYFLRRLYSDCESVIPVILESPGEKRSHCDTVQAVPDEVLKQECEHRAAASFLIVCRKNPQRRYTSIPSKEFSYVLIPEAVYDSYVQDPYASPFPPGVDIKVIKDKVKRRIEDHIDIELEIPNYEQALLDILYARGGNLFVHGVRLPLKDKIALFKKDPSLRRF